MHPHQSQFDQATKFRSRTVNLIRKHARMEGYGYMLRKNQASIGYHIYASSHIGFDLGCPYPRSPCLITAPFPIRTFGRCGNVGSTSSQQAVARLHRPAAPHLHIILNSICNRAVICTIISTIKKFRWGNHPEQAEYFEREKPLSCTINFLNDALIFLVVKACLLWSFVSGCCFWHG